MTRPPQILYGADLSPLMHPIQVDDTASTKLLLCHCWRPDCTVRLSARSMGAIEASAHDHLRVAHKEPV